MENNSQDVLNAPCSPCCKYFVTNSLKPHNTSCVHAKSLRLCPALCDHMDCSPPGSSVHGVLQVKILEWVAVPSSKGVFLTWPRDRIFYVFCTGRLVFFFTTSDTWEAPTKPQWSRNCNYLHLYWGNGGRERLTCGWARIWTQEVWLQNLCSEPWKEDSRAEASNNVSNNVNTTKINIIVLKWWWGVSDKNKASV